MPYLVPGTATMKHAHTTISLQGTMADLGAMAVKPTIAPPSKLLIGAKDAYYFVRITARTGGSVTAPFHYQPAGGEATTISGVFTP